jgi:1-acyl-sn-glycerol-3-phosphate acyltransferase
MQTLKSIWAWFAIAVLILVWVPIMFTVNVLDKDPGKYRTGRWFRRLGSAMTWANPAWRVRIFGNLPNDMRRPYVVVANHQSAADIPVFSRLPWDMKWMGKDSLFRLPILGWMMRLSRDIPVDRSSRMSRARVLGEAADRLRSGCSVMIMPEGTRSEDGSVGEFNDGAFRLAIKLGLPVLPIAVEGSHDALPKDTWRFGKQSDVRLFVFDPVSVDGLEASDAIGLKEGIRSQIIQKVAELRGVSPGSVGAFECLEEPEEDKSQQGPA